MEFPEYTVHNQLAIKNGHRHTFKTNKILLFIIHYTFVVCHTYICQPAIVKVLIGCFSQVDHALGPGESGHPEHGVPKCWRWSTAGHPLPHWGCDSCRWANVLFYFFKVCLHSFLHKSATCKFCFIDSDHIEAMDTVSLQAVTLVDGSTAYIQHSPKGIEIVEYQLFFEHFN